MRRKRAAGLYDSGKVDWRHKLLAAYEAAQGWIVVTIIGAAIGINAAFLNIITEWLSDAKMGYCTTAFYLNEKFCCWGEDNGCPRWHSWTGFGPMNYLIYITFAVRTAPAWFWLLPTPAYVARLSSHSSPRPWSSAMPRTRRALVSPRSSVLLLALS